MPIETRIEPAEVKDSERGQLVHCPTCEAWYPLVAGGHFELPAAYHESPADAE